MEDFITYELAVKLKEKGFRELCTHFYRNGNLTPQEMFCGVRNNTHPKLLFNSIEVKLKDTNEQVQVNIVDAPTISQVLKWLREEKRIHIIPMLWNLGWYVETYVYSKEEDEDGISYEFNIESQSSDYDSYELAALAGIEYVLDNLI